MTFDELYKKVINAQRAFEERHIPISLDFKIEDLRDALVESNDTIEKLKQKLEDAKATAYAESVDAGMENRRLKRALYKACANWANLEVFDRTVGIDDPNVEANRWALMRNKCLKKAEEYK